MIRHIESILIVIPSVIGYKEIEGYIKLQLQSHFPEPDLLIYDYVITGRHTKRLVLLTYMLKDDWNEKDIILHPHLLIKHRIWRSGTFLTKWKERELLIIVEDGLVTTVESDPHIIDKLNLENPTTIQSKELEKLYRRCKKDMFQNRKNRLPLQLILSFIIGIILTFGVYLSIESFLKNKSTLDRLEARYMKLLTTQNRESEEDKLYRITLEEVLKMESHISPSIYLLLTQLLNTDTKVIIKDFSYSGTRINLTLLTTNSLELLKELNTSPYLKMTLNSTVPGEEMELSQYSGEVLCP